MRKRHRGIDWVTVGPGFHFATCQRCGRHEPPPELPTPLAAAVLYMRYVVAKHAHCRPAAGITITLSAEDQANAQGDSGGHS